MIRNIIKIDEEKCNGCGFCVNACAEGAIQLVNGKARLVSETYCDGLGACLGHCPQGAIAIEQREAKKFDRAAVQGPLKQAKKPPEPPSGSACPGMKMLHRADPPPQLDAGTIPAASRLRQWPVQLKLLSPHASYFAGADLVLAADCVPFAMGDFHASVLKDSAIAVACPKLDNLSGYVEKIAEILRYNSIHSLTVVRMEVPCCMGLVRLTKEALGQSGLSMEFEEIVVALDGRIQRRIKHPG